ncbi:hypothetical protein L227DRAFT_38063 [Lentinus tigrinus ALCF2SS1-6]|uniref:Uncharacterized protein n=1 Tax=Lentinus tigrinus ALCF2SS1-6 TaxID=1328759 RepID=A0A5C2SFF2_9APHY|nr:hypothetical protein L227DRAFT_38063 [Lentinus tigrinus ALCF2SS1-6]
MAKPRHPQAYDFEGVHVENIPARTAIPRVPLPIPLRTLGDHPPCSKPGLVSGYNSTRCASCPSDLVVSRTQLSWQDSLRTVFHDACASSASAPGILTIVQSQTGPTTGRDGTRYGSSSRTSSKVRAQERHGAAAAGMKVRGSANPEAVLRYVEALERDPSEAARVAIECAQRRTLHRTSPELFSA